MNRTRFDKRPRLILFLAISLATVTISSCENEGNETRDASKVDGPLFNKVEPDRSGVLFRNEVAETPEHNYLTDNNFFSGGGVAAGDLNNDGLIDLYFTGNLVEDKVYLNKGNFEFEDITSKAITEGNKNWHRGVVITDVNCDGWNDIYVCRSGRQDNPAERTNLLYINNKDLTFTESAEEFGLADTSHSTQAAFFDYDLDGDLDVYVLNHPAERTPDQKPFSVKDVQDLVASGKQETDRLYRNDGGKFVDVSMESGINNFSYGLGIGIFDINHDGWPDIYVANDYAEPDFLYVNDGNGGFENQVKERTTHVSNFGMGVDVADFNNDLEPDILVMDMAYKSMVRSKKNMGAMAPEKFWGYIDAGYHYQYMINTLQLNLGNGNMTEMAQMAGVAKSDWSWSGIFEDLDNDGLKDIYITNGNKRDVRNNDAQINLRTLFEQTGGKADFATVVNTMPEKLVPNAVFGNNGDLTFSENAKSWGLYEASTMHGLVMADLDNDGDMDIVGNREDEPAAIYRNNSIEAGNSHYLQVELAGSEGNPNGIGSKVIVTQNGNQQLYLMNQSRGYQSGFCAMAHFGFGEDTSPVDVRVIFPDGGELVKTGVDLDQRLKLTWKSNLPKTEIQGTNENWFAETTVSGLDDFSHSETNFDDFRKETLLPQKYSQLGPFMSTADVNADGKTDVFISASAGAASKLYLGTEKGFKDSKNSVFDQQKATEDLGSVFLDYDADGDQDLLVIPGGNEQEIGSGLLFPRLYSNDGSGNFSLAVGVLPEIITSGMKAVTSDIDGDGDIDVFIGGRVTPGHYPFSPRSYLLLNEGGKFVDITPTGSPDLMGPGMITDAEFADMDGDGDEDLVVAGEWMPITVFKNEGGRFTNTSAASNLAHTNGWWYSIEIADLNEDGKLDIVAGNLGKNTKYHASIEEPFHVYWSDFDQNQVFDIVLAMHQDNAVYPVRGRECTSGQMPFVKQKFPTFEGFAEATIDQVYDQQNLDNALHLKTYELQSCVFLSTGDFNFEKQTLPTICQVAPINDIIAKDINGDGHLDLLAAGNNYDTEVETVRYDGGTGLLLLGDGKGSFEPMPVKNSGFYAKGNAKDLEVIETSQGTFVLVANNSDKIQAFKLRKPEQ